jgi:hypothetical protein
MRWQLEEAVDIHYRDGVVPDYFNGDDPRRSVDRREKPGTRKTFEVSKIWAQHDEIIRRLLLGQKATNIAADMGVSSATVNYVRKSPVVQDKLQTMRAARDADTVDLAKEIRAKAPIALGLLEKVINGDVDAPISVRTREAGNWLDRAGYSPVRNLQANVNVSHFTPEDIEDIKRRAVENGFARPSSIKNVTPKAESVSGTSTSNSD